MIDLADLNDISKSCYDELRDIKDLQAVDMKTIVNFDDVDACKNIDTLCPVLSSALKGAMGGKDQQIDGESPSDHAIRSLCYGAIFKARYVCVCKSIWFLVKFLKEK